MESYEIVEIWPDNPWYLEPEQKNKSHFFKGTQFAVVENIDDWEGVGMYQQPVAMFFGSQARSLAKAFCFTLNLTESE